jgi:hypothetical protein
VAQRPDGAPATSTPGHHPPPAETPRWGRSTSRAGWRRISARSPAIAARPGCSG